MNSLGRTHTSSKMAYREEITVAFGKFRARTVEAFDLLRRPLHDLCDKVEKLDKGKAGYWGIDRGGPVCHHVL
jgi:hypothetical protein